MGRMMSVVRSFGHFVLVPTLKVSRPSVIVRSTFQHNDPKLVPLAQKHTLLARQIRARYSPSQATKLYMYVLMT